MAQSSSVKQIEADAPAGRLKGGLGPIGIAMMVVATAAPLTVMVGVSPLIIGSGNGVAAPLDALAVGVVMLLFSIGFVAMSRYINNAGAFYAYILKGMGTMMGLGAASLAVLSYTLILIALEAYIGVVLQNTVEDFLHVHAAWWLYALAIVLLVGILGYRNVEVSAKVLGIALILEIGVIVLLDLTILTKGGEAGLPVTPFHVSEMLSGSPGLGVLFSIFGFIGFESTVVYREEASRPERSIPLATYIAVGFISLLYFVSFYCEIAGVGADTVKETASSHMDTLYLDLVTTYLGQILHDVAQILLVTSLFAVVISIHNIVARYKYVLGGCGVLSEHLAKVHTDHASPYVASVVQTAVSFIVLCAAVLFGFDPVTQIYALGAAAGTLGYMVIVALASFAIILFFARNKSSAGAWKTIIAPGLAFIGLSAFLFVALSNLPALTGSDGNMVNTLIVVVLCVAFMLGAGGGLIMKLKAPVRFGAIRLQLE